VAVVQLATPDDVAAVLGRTLTQAESDRVGAILDKASELFRGRSGQRFTEGTSEVSRIVVAGSVMLTQRPVVSVEAVTTESGDSVGFAIHGAKLTLSGIESGTTVHVSYTHGGTVPDLVRLTIAEIAKKVLSISEKAASGLTSNMRITGPFTDQETYATWAQGGQTMLAPDDMATADRYRVKVRRSTVMPT
jgi:hypothetical protein